MSIVFYMVEVLKVTLFYKRAECGRLDLKTPVGSLSILEQVYL